MTQISGSELLSSALDTLGAAAEVLVPGDHGYAGSAATLFAEDGTIANESTRKFITGLLAAFAAWIEKVQA